MSYSRILLGYLSFFIFIVNVNAQGTWTWNNRTHPELDWYTLETDHFNIHYHNGIEEIAKQGASIAEQVWPTLLKQMGLELTPRVDITLTAEDEVMNGYGMWTNMVFIWVDQNDAAIWLEDEKWLYQVIAHELQHIALFHALKTWLWEPWSQLMSRTPVWFWEGMAEYYTERWRPYRADISHKWHVLKNKMEEMNPHHDGYSKILYMADRFGDSTLVKIVQYRNKLKLYNFKKAMKEATGITLDQFEEDWRRHMNTYYYGYRAQKESFEDVGKVVSLPIKDVVGFVISPDSMKIAIVGRNDKDQNDQSLYIAERDTTIPKLKKLFELFSSKEDSAKKPPVRYNIKEIDHGQFDRDLSWSPDGEKLVYAKYRYGKHGSLIYDIRVIDVKTGKGKWITRNARASHPDWSPNGERIIFVAHKLGTSNLYSIRPDGTDQEKLTNYTGDTQIVSPRWSPDGSQIAFAISGQDGNCDIAVLNLVTKEISRVTDHPEVDYLPVWHPDGKRITYTSHVGSTPNLHTVDLETGESVQITDVGEPLWSNQWTPKGNTVTALTLSDVDSVRVVQVNPEREITTEPLSLRDTFTSWRSKSPDVLLSGIDPMASVDINGNGRYKFYRHPKHFSTLLLPYLNFGGLFGFTMWSDAMGRHLMQFGGGTDWTGTNLSYFVGYINAQHGPLWGLNYFFNTRWNFRYYDESWSGLSERLDGWNPWMMHPINFGTYMSSNHSIEAELFMQNRLAIIPYDSVDAEGNTYEHSFTEKGLPKPESGKEGIFSLTYQWVNRRPHKSNIALPKNGWGIKLSYDVASSSIYGDFSYHRLTFDSFSNIPFGPVALFLRGKMLSIEGDPPAQEYVGLSNDPPIYSPGDNSGGITSIIGLQENHNPRGWYGIRLGDRMVFSTAEFRFPLVPSLPVNIFGLSIGEITGALISDIANAWYIGQTQPKWVVTSGYEAKVALRLGNWTFLIFSVGKAQTMDDWKADQRPKGYARLSLINPF